MDSSYKGTKKSTSHYNSNGVKFRVLNKTSILYIQITLTSRVTELLPSIERMMGSEILRVPSKLTAVFVQTNSDT